MHPDNPTVLTALLKQLQRRSRLSADEADALLALPVRSATLDAGAYLVHEGEAPESCCVLLTGSAYRHKSAVAGARQILAVHLKGELLGLNFGLLPATDHSVQILSTAKVGLISHRAVLDLAAQWPNICQALWRETLLEASVAREWILNVGQRDARMRIAHLLCELALRQDVVETGGSLMIDWPLTQEQLGDATGLTSVHVNRTMQRLRGDGLIGTDRRSLRILDWEGLQDAGDFHRGYLHLSPMNPRSAAS